jgi:tRNA(Ser,Leu) C12 N-acetylase TAN1
MNDWNVVVTVKEDGFNKARELLERFGMVRGTDYFNILLMRVPDPKEFMEQLRVEGERDPGTISSLARVMPIFLSFDFQSPQQFEERAREAVTSWLSTLEGKSFHVRMHRRGFKGKLSGMEEEKFLDSYLVDELAKEGKEARVTFDNPDAIIDIETIGTRAGLTLCTRADLERYPLLHLD